MKEAIDELKRLNGRLAALLEDPHPGLMSWKLDLGKTLLHLAAFCGIEPVCDDAGRLSGQEEYKLP